MDINDFLDQPFTFTKRKQFIPCEMRPIWKMSLLIIIVGVLRKNDACSLKRIHVANWVTKKQQHLDELLDWSNKNTNIKPEVRMEPSVDKALELLISDGYLNKVAGRLEFSDLGEAAFLSLNQDSIFLLEKEYLDKAKRYLSDANVDRIFKVN